MFCQKCGEDNQENAKFCGHCGASLIGKSATSQKTASHNIEQKSSPSEEQEIPKKDNSRRTLLILLILFWPAGLIYYFAKRASIKEIHENNWFLEHPFLTWLIVYLCIFL